MTAFSGDGGLHIPAADKLGGLAMFQIDEQNLDTALVSRNIFLNSVSGYSMMEVFGSDME